VRQRQEDHEFEVILGYTLRSYLKKKKKERKKKGGQGWRNGAESHTMVPGSSQVLLSIVHHPP
jgi:hypothetical protein